MSNMGNLDIDCPIYCAIRSKLKLRFCAEVKGKLACPKNASPNNERAKFAVQKFRTKTIQFVQLRLYAYTRNYAKPKYEMAKLACPKYPAIRTILVLFILLGYTHNNPNLALA